MITHLTYFDNMTTLTTRTTQKRMTLCGTVSAAREKCDTWDRPLDDRGNTCMTVLTTLSVSVIDVYIVRKTQTQPSTSPKLGHKKDIIINVMKTIVGRISEKEARHVEERHKMTFHVCAHACY